ncbi:MAG: ferric reductase-like transmembrane domain-containing protein, partial [Fischerella sp.]|nr:ferric reductase-like transmembrane domain-containing protein [Fischerella sp.]
SALIARPISGLWGAPLRYRRALGVGAFLLAIVHTTHMMEHSLQWNFAAFFFLPLDFQWGIVAGTVALVLMTPAAMTSFDSLQRSLGKRWRQIHLLSLPALWLSVIHSIIIGSHYLGSLEETWGNKLATVLLGIISVGVLLIRTRFFWLIISLEKFYVPPSSVKPSQN